MIVVGPLAEHEPSGRLNERRIAHVQGMNGLSDRQALPVPFDVRLVAKIALSVAVASCVGLLLVLFMVTDDRGTNYGHLIGATELTNQNLKPALLVFGLVMVVFAGITTWLFSLYTSFRIAGPLYRITRDLETAIERGPAAPDPIRKTDQLQRERMQFDASVAALREHYEELRQALDDGETALRAETPDSMSLAQAIARLRKTEERVRL